MYDDQNKESFLSALGGGVKKADEKMASSPKKKKKKKKKETNRFKSTVGWVKQMVYNKKENHNSLINRFELLYESGNRQSIIDPRPLVAGVPVNILCIDGGGLRGYGGLKIIEYIQEKCQDKGSFCHQFDLVAGTSVGGIAALIMNTVDSTEEAILEGVDCLDEGREKTFSHLNPFKFLMKGRAVSKAMSLLKILENRYGTKVPLLNPDGLPACVLCTTRNDDFVEGLSKEYEPFVLRTYNYPDENFEENLLDGGDPFMFALAESSSLIYLSQAMAATSAVPGVLDRVRVNVDGKQRSLADGMLVANNPIAIALDEARRLCPDRPLGVVLSIGFDSSDDDFANRAIAIARLKHPNLHYQRIAPNKVFIDFTAKETDLKKIAIMEKDVSEFMQTNVGVNRVLDETLSKLFAPSTISTQRKWQKKQSLSPWTSRKSIKLTGAFKRRQMERQSIISTFK